MFARISVQASRQCSQQLPRFAAASSQFAGFKTSASKFTPVVLSAKKPLPLFTSSSSFTRSFHSNRIVASSSSTDKKNPFEAVDSSKIIQLTNEYMTKLQNASTEQLYHWSSYGLAGLAPVALILSPSFLNFPVDFALGLIIPVHMHIGLVGVVEDYVPRPSQSLARFVLAILAFFTGVGLLKINLCGSGITESIKSLWREPKHKEQKRIKQ